MTLLIFISSSFEHVEIVEALLAAVCTDLQRCRTTRWLGSHAAFHPLPGLGRSSLYRNAENEMEEMLETETGEEMMESYGTNNKI